MAQGGGFAGGSGNLTELEWKELMGSAERLLGRIAAEANVDKEDLRFHYVLNTLNVEAPRREPTKELEKGRREMVVLESGANTSSPPKSDGSRSVASQQIPAHAAGNVGSPAEKSSTVNGWAGMGGVLARMMGNESMEESVPPRSVDEVKLDNPSVPRSDGKGDESVPMLLEAALAHFGDSSYLCKFWDELSAPQQNALVAQFDEIVAKQPKIMIRRSRVAKELGELESLHAHQYAVANQFSPKELNNYKMIGLRAIAEGKVAAVVLAGGQATRLGATQPKGTISLGLKSFSTTDSLIALQAARIRRLQDLAKRHYPTSKCIIKWVVMTSTGTLDGMTKHLEKVLPEFGLSKEQVLMFTQGEFPCFDLQEKFMLAAKDKIATSPDGNGGLYAALRPHLNKLKEDGVQYLHVYCVDNVLCRVADPEFIGCCIDKESDCAAKVVEKTEPSEAVGVICLAEEKVKVVEYSEISTELAAERAEDGHLRFRAGNIANHFFTLDFLYRACSEGFELPLHRALKKIPFVNDVGELVKPDKPNGFKLERFVFDVFELSKKFIAYEVVREDEFSPLKCSEDMKKDCLSTCRRDLSNLHRRWLKNAGAILEGDGEVFIHPLKSYNEEELESFKGIIVKTPFVFQ